MAYIKAISYYLPENILSNETLQGNFADCDVEKTAKAIGVNSRRKAGENQTASDLAEQAALKLFKEYNMDSTSVDFVLFCTQSPDYFSPSTACLLQDKLGIPTFAGALDYDLGCSGYVYGLALAKGLISAYIAKNVLLLTADTTSKYLYDDDRNRILFGDGASASLISTDGFAEICDFVKGTDGRGYDKLIMRNGASRHCDKTGKTILDEEDNIQRDDYFYMDGSAIFNFTLDCVPQLIKDTIAKNNTDSESVDYYVFHQANKFMLNTIRKVCKVPKDKFYVNLEETGNTTSSTVPIGLKKSLENGSIGAGKQVMVAGFGVGLSWAATILKF